MSLYLETSSLLKLLLGEPGADQVASLLQGETRIVVSALTRLETLNVLQGMKTGGELSDRQHRKAVSALDELIDAAPFHREDLPGEALAEAENQIVRNAGYCRTLDRLHLGAMAALEIRRLMTSDVQQAGAARALGFEVLGSA